MESIELEPLAQRLGPGVNRVVPTSLAQILDLSVAAIRLAAGSESLEALLPGVVTPEDFVGPLAGCALADLNAQRRNIVTRNLGGNVG